MTENEKKLPQMVEKLTCHMAKLKFERRCRISLGTRPPNFLFFFFGGGGSVLYCHKLYTAKHTLQTRLT